MITRFFLVLTLFWQFLAFTPHVRAQYYEKVFSFSDARARDLKNLGSQPSGLLQASDGSFYGTTEGGGSEGFGTIFRMTPRGELTTLVEFTGAPDSGRHPQAALVQGSDGNFYGTTRDGGPGDSGTIFRMSPAGVLTTLVQFTGSDGSHKGALPSAALVQARDGNFYGTTSRGGAHELGTVFRMSPSGAFTTLVEFTGTESSHKGAVPEASLVQAADGNFYGTTAQGGADDMGTVFRITPDGVLTTLVEFTGSDGSRLGARPRAGLVEGADGNFYGTTGEGGPNDLGTVFKLTPGGILTTLVEFTYNAPPNRGSHPFAALIQGNDGNFYGTTFGGGDGFSGTVFRMTPEGVLTTLVNFENEGAGFPYAALAQGSDGNFYGTTTAGYGPVASTAFRMTPTGVLTTLVEFTGSGISSTGEFPSADLVQGSDGNLYGTTREGGSRDFGTVFRITPGGELTTLVEFTLFDAPNKGCYPEAALVEAGDGNFYGTTNQGGSADRGTVFRMTPAGVLTTLVEFTASEGARPAASLVQGSDGNFYGTTTAGGACNSGTVFRMTLEGTLTTLVEFTGLDGPSKGSRLAASLVQGTDGNFYGTTVEGGSHNLGTIFRMTPGGELTTLVEFTNDGATKGWGPSGALVQGSDGNFYGTTSGGGSNFNGTLFRMTPDGVLTTLIEFPDEAATGASPRSALLQAGDGNFYGTTNVGGANSSGTIFQMTPDGVLTTILEFINDGEPLAGLIETPDGILYGTTLGRGYEQEAGTIYRLVFPGAPRVFSAEVSTATSPSAEAIVNARGSATNVTFEYGTDGVTFPKSVPLAIGLNGFQSKRVGTALDGLASGATYWYRIRAASGAGIEITPVQSFSTLAEPMVATLPASGINATSARFNGTVNARNFDTAAVFEWGTDGNSFPNTAPAVPGTITGNADTPVSAAVAGLPEGGTVYYRLRATSAGGTVTSGVRSFATVALTTSDAQTGDFNVTEATFRATVNTFGRPAYVRFKYWETGAPEVILQTQGRSFTSSGAALFTEVVAGLLENRSYQYRVSVEIEGVVTDDTGIGSGATQVNGAPVPDPAVYAVFFERQIEFPGLDNFSDPNGDAMTIDTQLVKPPNVALGTASVTADGRSINYRPQNNLAEEDELIYRVRDARGLSHPTDSTARVRLLSFRKYDGFYNGTGEEGEEVLSVSFNLTSGGALSGRMDWRDSQFKFADGFDRFGRFTATQQFDPRERDDDHIVVLTLAINADTSRIEGSFTERDNGAIVAGPVPIVMVKDGATGGLAESGLRTGFLLAPEEVATVDGERVLAEGYVRMTIGKDARRAARFAGRLPDGEPFLFSAKAEGRAYTIARKLEQRGLFTGLVRALDNGQRARGMLGNLSWEKSKNTRGKYLRGGVKTMLSLVGVSYPAIAPGGLPPIGLGASTPNARLRLIGGGVEGYRDLLFHVAPGQRKAVNVQSDTTQTGKDLPLTKFQLEVDGANAAFRGRFLHPQTGKLVPFDGTFRTSLFDGSPETSDDLQSAQGRGVFRGPGAAGAVRVEGN